MEGPAIRRLAAAPEGWVLGVAVLAALIGSAAAARAQHGGDDPLEARPRVALVLGGGGARGIAHLGVLQVLEELQVPVDMVVGTSMGAIVGALYAAGHSPARLEEWLRAADWDELFRDQPAYRDLAFRRKREMLAFPIQLELGASRRGLAPPSGLIAGQKLNAELRRLLLPVATVADFDRLPLPFRAIATDLATGEMIELSRGDLVGAIRASLSAPGIFSPYEVDGRLLVDGGLARNLPADVARGMGADILIVVDVGTPLYTAAELTTPLRAARQVATMLVRTSTEHQRRGLTGRDVLIEPDLTGVGATTFGRAAAALETGRRAARAEAESLRALAVSPADYASWQSRIRTDGHYPGRVDFVVLGQDGDVSRASLLRRLRVGPGSPFDTAAVRRDIAALYGLGVYELVDYRLMAVDEDLVLYYDVREKAWGPNFLRFRLSVADNLAGEGSFNFAANLRVPQLNAWGAELVTGVEAGDVRRLRVELYQPIGLAGSLFVAPYTQFRVFPTEIYAGDRAIARYRTGVRLGGAAAGLALGRWGDARLGIEAGHVDATPRVGGADLVRLHAGLGRVYVQFEGNWLDDPLFPREGLAAGILLRSERAALGGDDPHDRLIADVLVPATVCRVTLVAGAVIGTALGSTLPAYDPFALGGFLMMTGYRPGELMGSHFLLGRLIVFGDVVRDRVFAGVAFESGNAWAARDDASLRDLRHSVAPMAGFRTPVGPLYLGYGFGDGGRRHAVLSIGRSASPRDYFP